jgi:hypothetical protein
MEGRETRVYHGRYCVRKGTWGRYLPLLPYLTGGSGCSQTGKLAGEEGDAPMPLAPAPASTCQHLHCQTARLLALQPTALHRSLSLTHTRTHTVCFGTLNLGFASTKRSLTALHSTREMISCSDVQNYPHGTLRVFVWGGSTLSLPKALQCSQWRASATGNVNQGPRELVTAPTSTGTAINSDEYRAVCWVESSTAVLKHLQFG